MTRRILTSTYRLASNITNYHILSKLILQRIIITNCCCPESHLGKVKISGSESRSNFRVKKELNELTDVPVLIIEIGKF